MKPYVYIIQNLERTHWYVGMRSANECPANEDTGYWGSSKYLKPLIKKTGKENWEKTIISEFDDKDIAHEFEQMLIELMWDLPGRVNKARNGVIDMDDPQVKEKHKAGCKNGAKKRSDDPVWRANNKAGVTIANKKKAQDPVWQANQKAGAQKKAQDPEYRAKHKTGCQKKAQDPEWIANQKVGGQKRAKPFIATSIATGEEYFCESGTCDQAKALKLASSAVSRCLNGKYSSTNYKGFTFRYDD